MKAFSIIVCFSLLVQVLFSNAQINEYNSEYQLELLQVFFRHGDRIPAANEVYKTDPYNPEHYAPRGYGQLTQVGLRREYKIGTVLRQLYNDYLGEYKVDEVYAYSTNFDRTKMSLQLALAGAYPPTRDTAWNDYIFWSPIPTHHTTGPDFLDVDVNGPCTNNGEIFLEAENVPELREKYNEYSNFIKYVKKATNVTITPKTPFSGARLYNNLRAALSMGLPLPRWCSEEDFRKLEEIAAIFFEGLASTNAIRKALVGPVIDKLLENIKSSDDSRNKIKVYYYGTHDTTVGPFIASHNFSGVPAIPDYGTTVMVEKLRGKDNQVFVKMLLWTGVSEQLIPLEIKECGLLCPLSKYKELVQPMIPNEKEKKCYSNNNSCSQR